MSRNAAMARSYLPLVACLLCATRINFAAETLVRTAVELERAAAAAQQGDVVRMTAGEWQDVDLVFEARGTEGAPITLAAERPGETIVTGDSRLRIAGEHLVVHGLQFRQAYHPDAVLEFRRDSKRLASHCRVTECVFSDCNPPAASREDSKYVSIYGRENRFDHCVLSGKMSRGTTLVVWLTDETSGAHRLDGNYFGPRPPLRRNGGETIRIGDSQTSQQNARCLVEGNLFEQCSGEAEIISNKSCENEYRHNTFRGCGGALTLRHGERCTVDGNWFFGDSQKGTGGVRVIGPGHRVVNNYFEGLTGDDARAAVCVMSGLENSPLNGYAPVVEALIANNTFIECRQPVLIGFGDEDVKATVHPRNCRLLNNLCVGRRGPFLTVLGTPVKLECDSNLVFGAESGLPEGTQTLEADPVLSPSPEDWQRLAPGSPACGAAQPVAQLDIDIEGQPRVRPLCLGCDQVSDSPVLFHPLSRQHVGPAWRW